MDGSAAAETEQKWKLILIIMLSFINNHLVLRVLLFYTELSLSIT